MTACAGENTIAALLAGAVDADAAARLEIHLDRCAVCRRLVADLGRGLSAIDDRRGTGPALPRPGDTLGRYEIRRAVGVGGMGVVYEAHDTTLDRRVALKLVRPELVDSAHLLAEARAMARLQHPNIATVHDAGTADGHVYVCMEFVAGTTLSACVADRSWREIVQLYLAAGEGLAYVHRAGLVHRDFKPDNVLVDRDGRVRVSDFGLARIVGTSPRAIAGTPAYMAPEQRRGEHIDARADQYAFCVSLREALGGAAPHWLARTLDRGLAPHPADRYATMEALLAAISRGLSRKRRGAAVLAVMVAGAAALVATTNRPATASRIIERPGATRFVTRDVAPTPVAASTPGTGSITSTMIATTPASTFAARMFAAPQRVVRLADVAPLVVRAIAKGPSADSSNGLPSDGSTSLPPPAMPAGACDDGAPRTCAWPPPYCPATTIAAIVDGCWTCADEQSCTPLGAPRTCNDGSKLRCSQRAPTCPGHTIPAIHDGCWACADPFTCPSRPTITHTKQPPPTGSGGSGAARCGNLMCEVGEDHASCPSDCCQLGGGSGSGNGSGACVATCGNGMCEAGEDHASCANDCCELSANGTCVPVCGNGFCEQGETCAADC